MANTFTRRRLLHTSAAIAGASILPKNRQAVAAQPGASPVASPEIRATPVTSPVRTPPEGAAPEPEEPPIRSLVRMSPQNESQYALPATTIAFRGVTADQLGNVMVTGSLSGPVSGVLREHSDGRGVSWVHDSTFLETEEVTVTATIPLTTAPDGAARFVIGEQAIPLPAQERVSTRPEPDAVHTFKSRPDLGPVQVDVVLYDEERTTPGLMAVTPHVPNGQAGATLFDNNGQPIWHHAPANPDHSIYCLKQQTYLGQPVLTWSEGAQRTGYGYSHHVIANQNYEPIAYVQGGHGVNGLDVHDLVLSEYGTAWVFSYHPVWTIDRGIKRNVLNGVIQEIDVVTGDVWWEWHSLDHVPLAESFRPRPKDRNEAWDYIHINSLEIDYDGNLLFSSRSNHTIYRISTEDHKVIWRLGGKQSDFELTPDAVFRWQHDARRLEDGTISLFDNVDSDNQANSRGLVFELDDVAMNASLIREYYREGGMHSPYQGNLQILDNGNVFIGWGSGPRCTEFTHEGEAVYEIRYRAGVSYRGYRVDWQGFPTEPIAYFLEDAPDGTLSCQVSWNGATEIAEWRVVTDTGSELARAPKKSFETKLSDIVISPIMEVQALNAAGDVLGRQILNRGN